MNESPLDELPENVQKAIYQTFCSSNTRDKVIFLARLHYGTDLSYKELSSAVGVTIQRIQQMCDNMIDQVRHSPYVTSGVLSSGVFL